MAKRLTWIDFRKEIEELKDSEGFRWVALRSADLTKQCMECARSVNDSYDQPNPYCSSCLGTGFGYVDKLVKGYRYLSTPGFDFRTQLGIVNTESQVYILEHDTYPKEVDLILELEQDELKKPPTPRQPFVVMSVFKIQHAFPVRGSGGGRIEFWRCFVEERNFSRGKKGYL